MLCVMPQESLPKGELGLGIIDTPRGPMLSHFGPGAQPAVTDTFHEGDVVRELIIEGGKGRRELLGHSNREKVTKLIMDAQVTTVTVSIISLLLLLLLHFLLSSLSSSSLFLLSLLP